MKSVRRKNGLYRELKCEKRGEGVSIIYKLCKELSRFYGLAFFIIILSAACKKSVKSDKLPSDVVPLLAVKDWKALAEESAEKQSAVKQIYSSESTLQALIALSHAVWQAKHNPEKDILFFYSNKSLKPNVPVFAHLPIRFVLNDPPDQLFLGKNSYEIIASFLKKADGTPAPFNLYLCDRAMYDDPSGLAAMNAYYMAQAHQVVCYEEGTLSYTYGSVVQNLKEKKRLLEEQWGLIKKQFPIEAGKDNYERYQNSNLKNSVYASGWDNSNRLSWVNLLDKVATAWQYPDAAQIEEGITTESKKIRITIKPIYQALSKAEQKDFCKYFNYDIDGMHEKYFKRRDNKKNLVLIGTHFQMGKSSTDAAVDNTGNRNLVAWLKLLIKKFGDKYRILYKPHPRYIAPYKKLFQDSGIADNSYVMIEEVFPLELIELNEGADKYAGALSSALYFEGIAPKTDHVINLNNTSVADNKVWQVFKRMRIFQDASFKTIEQLKTEWGIKDEAKTEGSK